MKRLFAAIRQSPARSAALLTLAAAIIVPATMFAWGPGSRTTFTTDSPASYVTFNSITNNPKHGDELNFVQIKEAGTNDSYTEKVELQPGKEYQVRVYFHNNASCTFNSDKHNNVGIARDTKVRVQMPASVKAGEEARFTGIVSASNAKPEQVWDEAWGVAKSNVALRYIQDSAKITSHGKVNGATLSNDIVTTGAPIGFDKLDGNLPGCEKFAGYVYFRFKVDQPDVSLQKKVSKHGENNFVDSIKVNADDKVDYRIVYQNTGTTQLNNVVVKDQLPEELSLVPGTVQIANSKTGGSYESASNNLLSSKGANIGSYAPKGNAFMRFTASINADKLECGVNTITNKAVVETANGGRTDTAEVIVEKECEEPTPEQIEVCEVESKNLITINEKDFDEAKHSHNLADCDEETPITPEEPEVPAELPQTGIAGSILSILGLGATAAGAAYFANSRRA